MFHAGVGVEDVRPRAAPVCGLQDPPAELSLDRREKAELHASRHARVCHPKGQCTPSGMRWNRVHSTDGHIRIHTYALHKLLEQFL